MPPDLIFVSIAAYRDPQLIPTIEDALAKAADPTRLRFGICWQRAEQDPIPSIYRRDARFRILDVPYTQSKGACWARAEIMKLSQHEPWFLQVDSHCRFAPHWDQRLIQMAAATRSPKPILSTYATAFTPGLQEVLEDQPLQMAFQGFTADGIPYMKPVAIPDWQTLTAPIPARFLSGGFLFAPGSFLEHVPYDPNLYFLGEEITMTLRAFTSGYDLFHPHQTLVWHDYRRADGIRHWDDHTAAKPAATTTWGDLDLLSKERVRTLLSGQHLDTFSLGQTRTLADYEQYAGISFHHRKVQDYTVRASPPPNPPAPPDWASAIYTWMVRIALPASVLEHQTLAETAFWYLGIADAFGSELYRRDLTAAEIQALPNPQPETVLICELQSGSIPATWKIWPHTKQGIWLPLIEGSLSAEDFAIVFEEEA